MNRLLRFLVDSIGHFHQNRQKIDAFDIAANTSVGSLFHDLPTTPAFSTSKIDLHDRFMVCCNLN